MDMIPCPVLSTNINSQLFHSTWHLLCAQAAISLKKCQLQRREFKRFMTPYQTKTFGQIKETVLETGFRSHDLSQDGNVISLLPRCDMFRLLGVKIKYPFRCKDWRVEKFPHLFHLFHFTVALRQIASYINNPSINLKKKINHFKPDSFKRNYPHF